MNISKLSTKGYLSILYTDDNVIDFVLYKHLLEKSLHETYKIELVNTKSLEDTLSIISKREFDIVIVDLNLLDSRGAKTFSNIKNSCSKKTPVFVITGFDDYKTRRECLRNGAEDFFVKGENDMSMINTIISLFPQKAA